jgi:hypothetical protein
MTTVNSLSGGKTSSYMAIHFPCDVEIFACVCIDDPKCAPKDQSVKNYCLDKLQGNFIASAEHGKTLWVRGKSFDEIIDNNSSLPSWNRRFCTIELKIIPIFEYCYFKYGKVKMNIGFRADEPDRILSGEVNTFIEYPLSCKNFGERRFNWSSVDWRETDFPLRKTFHFEIIKWWKNNLTHFDFPKDSNCRGCHHKPEQLIKKNWEETPEILEWFARQEEKETGRKIHTWKDSMIPYREIFKLNFTEEINFENHTMCNSGGCLD